MSIPHLQFIPIAGNIATKETPFLDDLIEIFGYSFTLSSFKVFVLLYRASLDVII